MAASVGILRITGAFAGQSTTDITGLNTVANAEDAHYPTATLSSNPVRIPALGTNYSYWVTTRLIAYTTPAGTINNIRWYTTGSNNFGTGVTATAAQSQSYVQATGTIGTTGIQLTVGNHTGSLASPVDPFTVYPGSSTALAVTGSLANPSTGQFGNYVVYQLAVATTASPGATGQNTFTWLYDET
jgi:hypothetical protein